MKVLTVRQPWAGLIARGIKDIESRTWAPTRGLYIGDRFAVHAAVRDDDLDAWPTLAPLVSDEDMAHELSNVHGLIVCTVRLRDVTRDAASPWAVPDLWHWRLDRVHRVRNAPELAGRRGLWDLPLDHA